MPLAPNVDAHIDRYELIGELASGGMAVVYLARLPGVGGFQRLVAIKRLHPHLSQEREFVEMFLDEARLAASIHHSHVVPILEVGSSDAGFYVVMEFIEGESLAALIDMTAKVGARLPVSIILRVMVDVLNGLHAAHEARDESGLPVGLVHRDVSPQNVLVGVDGGARITDFGVARASSRLANTRSGTLKGKLAYMAPEQAQSGPIDRRADIFSAAVVLWEVLADKRLFKGETELHTLNKLLYEPVPRLRDCAPDLPPLLEAEITRALSPDRAERHPSAAAFADALERAASGAAHVASRRELTAYVETLLAPQISSRRAAVRLRGAGPDSLRSITASAPPSRASGPLPRPPASVPSAATSAAFPRPSVGSLGASATGSLPRLSSPFEGAAATGPVPTARPSGATPPPPPPSARASGAPTSCRATGAVASAQISGGVAALRPSSATPPPPPPSARAGWPVLPVDTAAPSDAVPPPRHSATMVGTMSLPPHVDAAPASPNSGSTDAITAPRPVGRYVQWAIALLATATISSLVSYVLVSRPSANPGESGAAESLAGSAPALPPASIPTAHTPPAIAATLAPSTLPPGPTLATPLSIAGLPTAATSGASVAGAVAAAPSAAASVTRPGRSRYEGAPAAVPTSTADEYKNPYR